MKWIGLGIATLAVWGATAYVAVQTGDNAVIGAAVMATLVIWILGGLHEN